MEKPIRYTSLNGHMFSFLAKENRLSIRFSKTDQAEFIEHMRLQFQYNTVAL